MFLEFLICALVSMAIGLAIGSWRRDEFMWKLLRDQQKRGDYWFDKYQQAIGSDWEPTEDIS